MQLPHEVVIIGRRRILGDDAVNKMAQVNLLGKQMCIRDSLEAEQNRLEETRGQLENARAELQTPFAREAELAEKTKRLKELNILLNMDEKDKTLMDDGPDEGEEMPERKVVGLER